jgi:hypothetical protein
MALPKIIPKRSLRVLKYLGHYLLQLPSLYRRSEKPHIFLFSTRRSGSTLIRNAIYSQPGFNYISEPFVAWVGRRSTNPYKRYYPGLPDGPFVSLTESQWSMLKDYLRRLLRREYVVNSQCRVWRADYHWVWERYVVKILAAKALIERFEADFGSEADFVFHIRHPIATALSSIAHGFRNTASRYLEDDQFCKHHLSPSLIGFCHQVLGEWSSLERFVLNWCLDNLVPLRLWRERDWVTVSHEQLVCEPLRTSEWLCQQLKLPAPTRMARAIQAPTHTASRSSRASIAAEGPAGRADAWTREVDSARVARVGDILDRFEIAVYACDDPMPGEGFGCPA